MSALHPVQGNSLYALQAAQQQSVTPISRAVPVQSVQFGLKQKVTQPKVYVDPSTGRIDNEIYNLITQAPKTELHVHQGGSTSVEFMIYSYRKAIMDGTILDYLGEDKSLPIYHANGDVERVSLVDEQGKLLPQNVLTPIMERVLTRNNMEEYLRIESIGQDNKSRIPNHALSETSRGIPEPGTDFNASSLEKIKDVALKEYLATTGKMNRFNRNPAAAYLIANLYAKEAAFENVRYLEYRVSASGNGIGGNNGVDLEGTLSAVAAGMEDAKAYLDQRLRKLDYGLIVLMERQNRGPHEPPNAKVERAIKLATEVVRLKKEGKYNIAGVDLAGDEAHNPVTEFAEAFKIIQDYNASVPPERRLGITIHAGETARSRNVAKGIDLPGWQSLEKAIALGHDSNTSMRAGHGLQLINSSTALQKAFETYLAHPDDWEQRINIKDIFDKSPLLKYIRDNQILLEVCPKSNLQTYGVHPNFADAHDEPGEKYTSRSYKRHPAVFLSRLGVKISLSGDNRTVSNTDTANEYVKLYKYAGLTYQDLKKMAINGFEAAFIPEEQRSIILKDVNQKFKELEHTPRMIHAIRKMDGRITLAQHLILLKERCKELFKNVYQSTQLASSRLNLAQN